MKIIDANKAKTHLYNFDIAIIGAGIIGIFFAFLLRNSKYKIILIERGSKNFNSYKEKRTITKGVYHHASQSSKGFMLGGNSSLWGGQLSEFTKEDIKKNFWGLEYNKLKKLYNEVYKILKIKCNSRVHKNNKYKIGFYFTYFLKEPNLFKYFKEKLLNSKNILIISNLIAQELVFKGNVVKSLKCKNHKNNQIILNAKNFYFCLGTIENIRFFLTNKLLSKKNPLKRLRLIGHFFQDHLEIVFGRLFINSKKKFSQYFENMPSSNLVHQPKICNILKNKDQLSVFMGFISDTDTNKLARESKNNLKEFKYNLSFRTFVNLFDLRLLKYTFLYIIHYLRFKKIKLFFNKSVKATITSEQVSLFDSKITINNKKLKDGLNQAVLDWKVSGKEFQEIKIFIIQLISFFKKTGIGDLKIKKILNSHSAFISNMKDTNHPSGGLIISKKSKNGVCDQNFKVWGTSNLYVLGSALFPNSGRSNVTLTSMALALKLSKKILLNK